MTKFKRNIISAVLLSAVVGLSACNSGSPSGNNAPQQTTQQAQLAAARSAIDAQFDVVFAKEDKKPTAVQKAAFVETVANAIDTANNGYKVNIASLVASAEFKAGTVPTSFDAYLNAPVAAVVTYADVKEEATAAQAKTDLIKKSSDDASQKVKEAQKALDKAINAHADKVKELQEKIDVAKANVVVVNEINAAIAKADDINQEVTAAFIGSVAAAVVNANAHYATLPRPVNADVLVSDADFAKLATKFVDSTKAKADTKADAATLASAKAKLQTEATAKVLNQQRAYAALAAAYDKEFAQETDKLKEATRLEQKAAFINLFSAEVVKFNKDTKTNTTSVDLTVVASNQENSLTEFKKHLAADVKAKEKTKEAVIKAIEASFK